MGTLNGKTAVVVGASGQKNFGVAIARRLAAEGAHVVVSGRRSEPLEALAAEIGGQAVACDVTDESQIKALFDTAAGATGKVDIAGEPTAPTVPPTPPGRSRNLPRSKSSRPWTSALPVPCCSSSTPRRP